MPEPLFDVFDETDGVDIELACGVTAKVASELSGIPVAWIKNRVVKYGKLGITNCSLDGSREEMSVRLSND
jgi:hypothetical protein